MITSKSFVLNRSNKKPLVIDVHYTPDKSQQPIVIFCHGYKGFKDWGAWHLMAKAFANAGCCFIKFNFSHNGGTVNDVIDFPDLEAFGQNNYSKELDDLKAIIDWAVETFKTFDTNTIYLIGHSRGGGIVTITAAEDPRVKGVITLAGVSDYKTRFVKGSALSHWKKEGVLYVLNGRTKQQMPHYYQFYEDFMANAQRLNIKRAVQQLQVPYLIIHGANDPTVMLSAAKQLHQWQPNSILKVIAGADHVFNTKHPWTEDLLSKALQDAVDASIAFIDP